MSKYQELVKKSEYYYIFTILNSEFKLVFVSSVETKDGETFNLLGKNWEFKSRDILVKKLLNINPSIKEIIIKN